MLKFLIIIFSSTILVSCLSVKDYFYQKKKVKIYHYNESKIKSIDVEVSLESDTLLKFFCNDYYLCDSSCNYIFWIYKNENGVNVMSIERGLAKFKMSSPKKQIIPEAQVLFEFIALNKLDTVHSSIKTDRWCDHCGGLGILYKINNDTIIDRYIDHGQLSDGDTSHILHKYAMRVINQLNAFENNTANTP